MDPKQLRILVDNARAEAAKAVTYVHASAPEKPAWVAVAVFSLLEGAFAALGRAVDLVDEAIANGAQ